MDRDKSAYTKGTILFGDPQEGAFVPSTRETLRKSIKGRGFLVSDCVVPTTLPQPVRHHLDTGPAFPILSRSRKDASIEAGR